jgi:protein-disulfide isomerase
MSGNAPATGTPREPAVTPRMNTLAIVSFVSAFCVGLVAIITGHIALGQIRTRGEAGRALAVTGLILGYLGVAVTAMAVVLTLVLTATFATLLAFNPLGGGDDATPSAPSADPRESAVPQGRIGAANFDQGYLELGTGPVVIDEFFEPLCPYCKTFEETNGPQLALAVENNVITLRLHALTFLDPASNGSEYSSRAAAALTCEASVNPDSTLDYLAALYENQPAENTSGLTDAELIALSAGSTSIADCVSSGQYQAWSQLNTAAAFAGNNAKLQAITGTPTTFVDGVQYRGAIDDAGEFSQFVSGAFGR